MKRTILVLVATLMCSAGVHAQSIGDYQSHQSGPWSDVASWERYDGSTWVTPAPASPTSADGVITILGGHTITVDAPVTVDQVIVNTTGNVTVAATKTLTVADASDTVDMVVNGTLNDFGTVTATGRISFENGGSFIYSVPAGGSTMPSATWRTGSTCRIDSTTGTTPTNLNTQVLYNLIWNGTNAGANGGPNFADGAIIYGDVTVLSTKNVQWRLTNLSGGQTKTVNIRGNLTVGGATALLTSTGSGADTAAKAIINVDGNVIVTAGQWSLNNSGSAYAEWRIKGNISITGGTLQSGSSGWFGRRTLNFAGGTSQTFTVTSPGTIGSAATVFKVSNGSAVQVGFPWTLMNNGALNLENGRFVTTSTNVLAIPTSGTIIGGSSSAYVDGPLTHTVAAMSTTAKTFPIGKGTAYRPVVLTVNQDAATSTTYKAEVFNTAPPSRVLPGSLGSVSSVRYVNVTKGTGANLDPTLGATIKLSYDADDLVTDATIIRIAKDDGAGNWVNLGGSGTANTSGSITSNSFYSFSDFVLATINLTPITASATWTLDNTDSPTVEGLLSAGDETFGDSLYRYDFSLVGSTNAARMITKSGVWPAQTGPDSTRYVQYAVAPQAGGTFYVDSISFSLGAAFTNNLRASVFYSNDSTFTAKTALVPDTALVASTLVPFTFGIARDTVLTGQKIYVRIYPYDTNAEGFAKLMYVSNVRIAGNTVGLAVQPPTVSTANVTYISATFATSGGNVSADGGGAVTARGVCWNTGGSPTITDSHTTDGNGNGPFTSSVTGLTPGATYHLRAYATNAGGTAYGDEKIFAALASVVSPTVTTTAISSILVTTAVSGGNVTDWGGASVTAKGVCWNTTGSPTISNSHSVDGIDVGAFTSGLSPLVGNTPYYVRAYATNSAGTGYGNELSFTTAIPAPDTTVVVAQDGSGNYLTVQAAFRAVPANYTGHWTIFVKNGVYYEKDTLAVGKINVILVGQDRDSTIITYDDYADRHGTGNPGTSGSFSIAIDASDFTAKNITFRNTYSPQPNVTGTQAVALRTQGDRHEYINCRILGYQDTYYTWGGNGTGRMYHRNCFIEGTVDFIFGRNIVVFDSCTIHEIRNGGTLTAGATDPTTKYGYVFRNCVVYADSIGYDNNPITAYYLGRPWQASPRTVFIHSFESWNLSPAGWQAWNVTPGLYAEYSCFGAGSATGGRILSSQLSDSAALTYTLTNIFARSSASSNLILYDWMPANAAGNFLPLPIQLASFTGLLVNNTIRLDWTTISEVNNYGFYVQRKRQNETVWSELPNSFIHGHGTTNVPQHYTFTDGTVTGGLWQYRLKQVDLDGTQHFTEPVLVSTLTDAKEAAPREFSLKQNYPNPFNPTTEIKFSVETTDHATLELYNVLGQKITSLFDGVAEAGQYYKVRLTADRLATGVYFYRLQSGKRSDLKKLMLIK